MQRVFYAKSIFTDDVDDELSQGLDNLLRTVSTQLRFDRYSHDKLSVVFHHFQQFLQSHGQRNYTGEQHDWTTHEMLTTVPSQFEGMLISGAMMPDLDRHAVRLSVALLNHGKNQLHSPKQYCELPDAVGHELSDYLALALHSTLGVVVPDRLD